MSTAQETSSNRNSGHLSRLFTRLDGAEESVGPDHAINLIDATTDSETAPAARNRDSDLSLKKLAREDTRTSVRKKINKRKYDKWNKARFSKDDIEAGAGTDTETTGGIRVEHPDHSDSEAVDFARGSEVEQVGDKSGKERKERRHHKKHGRRSHKKEQDSHIDILYENQRGAFFCGIPLYSHSSLLNFDPSPWVNAEFHDSPVNITNAQVPDPSWQWAWKHWYVDMSSDVDEDGWQYSFAFFGNFAWHGTHPWFHSFVRRRRWLRKRVKTDAALSKKPQPSSMSAAHKLNTDYFTIHSKRDRSPSLLGEGPRTARPDSYISYRSVITSDEPPEDIKDVASLVQALRIANIDREKIDVVKKFIDQGGEELAYLRQAIPEIMSFLVFQNSRRQLLEYMREQAREAQKHREEHEADDRPEGDAEERRINNLLNAVKAADDGVRGLEYWSDRKHVLQTTEDTNTTNERTFKSVFDQPGQFPKNEDTPGDNIKGISDKAQIGSEPISERIQQLRSSVEKLEQSRKGKEKAREENDQEDTDRMSPRLKADQVLIPDEAVGDESESKDEAHHNSGKFQSLRASVENSAKLDKK